MPSQPRSPSLRENAGSTPDSQVSTWVVKLPAASSAARNSRTSARTCSAASDRGAGASVKELLLILRRVPDERPPGCLRGLAAPSPRFRGSGEGGDAAVDDDCAVPAEGLEE